MLRAIVVDDEPAAIESLCLLLKWQGGELVRVEGSARSVAEALELVERLKPEVVFLDVEMPGESGFDFLRAVPQQDIAVIFVTAHEHYAIQALRMSAVDYLLKPVDPIELRAALERVWQQRRRWQRARWQALLSNLEQPKPQRLVLPVLDGFQIVPVEEVLYCQSEGSYSRVVTAADRILTTRLLGQWEELLEPMGFLRIHRAFLVNVQHIRKVRRDMHGECAAVILSSGEELPISRRRLALVLERLQHGG